MKVTSHKRNLLHSGSAFGELDQCFCIDDPVPSSCQPSFFNHSQIAIVAKSIAKLFSRFADPWIPFQPQLGQLAQWKQSEWLTFHGPSLMTGVFTLFHIFISHLFSHFIISVCWRVNVLLLHLIGDCVVILLLLFLSTVCGSSMVKIMHSFICNGWVAVLQWWVAVLQWWVAELRWVVVLQWVCSTAMGCCAAMDCNRAVSIATNWLQSIAVLRWIAGPQPLHLYCFKLNNCKPSKTRKHSNRSVSIIDLICSDSFN